MAWFFLDTHAAGSFRYGSLAPDRVRVTEGRGRANVLLSKIAARFAKGNPEGVCVVQGPGSFSAVRTGVLYANLLSRLLGLPLIGVSPSEAADLPALAQRLADGSLSAVPYVAPVYDAEPNITFPKTA